jgi:alkaline phosphatase
MRQAVDAFNAGGLDFAIELGDLKDMGVKPDRAEALGFLDAIEAEFARFAGPRYHVLGNHDMDCISKEDFLAHTENYGAAKDKRHYSFVVGGVKFVVLDACFNKDMTPYRCGNFDWTKAFIPEEELAWFDEELKAATTPVVVFSHQLLDGFSVRKGLRGVFVGNWKRVVEIMEKGGNVLASIQGHHHQGHYSFRNGIHYWTMKAMISGAYPPHNSYAVVEVSPDGDIAVKGFGDCESRVLQRGSECKGHGRKS